MKNRIFDLELRGTTQLRLPRQLLSQLNELFLLYWAILLFLIPRRFPEGILLDQGASSCLETPGLAVQLMLQPSWLPSFPVNPVFTTAGAVFSQLHSLGIVTAIFDGRIIPLSTISALQSDYLTDICCFSSHFYSSNILVKTPAPTVRPPSRIANLRPSSIATGVTRLMVILTLSPGITISTPSGNTISPVISLVLI